MIGRPIDDLTSRRFDRLVVCTLHDRKRRQYSYGWMTTIRWKCVCDCGKEVIVASQALRSGQTKSCGCWRKERSKRQLTTHGLGSTPEYRIWCHLKGRCLNPNDASYANYGGRGIKVCEAWAMDFETFLQHVGRRPSRKHQLDRIDNNGNYEPGNVRWVTPIVNNGNRRISVRVSYLGVDRPLTEWSMILGVPRPTLNTRYQRGWPAEDILFGRQQKNAAVGVRTAAFLGVCKRQCHHTVI